MGTPADPRQAPVLIREGQYRKLVRTGEISSPYYQPYAIGRVARVTHQLTRESPEGTVVNLIGLLHWAPESSWWTCLAHTELATEEEWHAQRVLDELLK